MMKKVEPVHILLVEDNPDHAHLTLTALNADTPVHSTYWVKDGQEALDFLHRQGEWTDAKQAPRPGLILLDINLPKVSGHEVLQTVKAHEGFRSIPVVMLTTANESREVAATYRAGANSFITKRVDFQQYKEQIKALKDYWTLTSHLPAA